MFINFQNNTRFENIRHFLYVLQYIIRKKLRFEVYTLKKKHIYVEQWFTVMHFLISSNFKENNIFKYIKEAFTKNKLIPT